MPKLFKSWTYFFKKNQYSCRWFVSHIENESDGTEKTVYTVDDDKVDQEADKYSDYLLPVIAGLVSSVDEVMQLNADQFFLMRSLAKKALELKGEAIANGAFKILDKQQELADKQKQAGSTGNAMLDGFIGKKK